MSNHTRVDGRLDDALRPVSILPHYLDFPDGSVLIVVGKTRVLCNAAIQPGVPRWMQNEDRTGGWVTAEYAMLPQSTPVRMPREGMHPSGRTMEIRRLIGRSLRAAVDLQKLGEYTLTIDCDVLQADGGTRTAAVTGGYVALALAIRKMRARGLLRHNVLKPAVAAVSVGVVDGRPLLDLAYVEDSRAEVDANIVMNAAGQYIEVQSTAEGEPVPRSVHNQMLDLAERGITDLLAVQKAVLVAED